MQNILNIIQMILAVLLVIFILIQQRGAGMGGIFGGDGGVYRTKRGAEKFIFTTTIVLAILFLAITLASVFLQK
jgi:preprotein translocase subunit SecG